eukprot:Amastigsp_a512612_61.p5 type:complete len:102 gc:universal Amastigsp_a512612_61:518-213(-)
MKTLARCHARHICCCSPRFKPTRKKKKTLAVAVLSRNHAATLLGRARRRRRLERNNVRARHMLRRAIARLGVRRRRFCRGSNLCGGITCSRLRVRVLRQPA